MCLLSFKHFFFHKASLFERIGQAIKHQNDYVDCPLINHDLTHSMVKTVAKLVSSLVIPHSVLTML